MLNYGNINLDNATPVNELLRMNNNGGTLNSIGSSTFSAPEGGVLVPGTIYSAAGTPLPAASAALKGATAIVDDATTPTYGGAYTSGGAVYARVLCDGTAWITA